MKGYNKVCDCKDCDNVFDRDKVHAYRVEIQSRFSRKRSLKRKMFILYFRLLFSRRITPFPLAPPIINHPVCKHHLLVNKLQLVNKQEI